ncbi:MAG: S46 family peptidase [Ignavibacteria bacterium]|nr:S46 family peptidase [Ignavibacteria bacterium]
MMKRTFAKLSFVVVLSLAVLGGCATYQAAKPELGGQINLDTVKAGMFDTGRMWTFDYPPIDYFKTSYGFAPDEAWFEKARLAALRLPNCSASFVSEDGLVFTNHHCARGALDRVNREGENLPEHGFFASTLAEERKVPRLYVDQLVLIEDVTDEVQKAFESGRNDDERVANRNKAIEEIEKRYQDKTKLNCNVVSFYNGGKFSLYGFKRYNDVRLVFAPELQLGFYGGDWDNFTYPRYDLDISFFRVYDDNGQPLKSSNYFKWSARGATEGEAVFVIGNPGRTNRLFTYSQIEFQRDYAYPFVSNNLNNLVRIFSSYLAKHPDQKLQYQTQLFGYSNSQKLYVGRVKGLQDPILMAKKRDFEKTFKKAVLDNPQLRQEYGHLWDEIAGLQIDKGKLFSEVQSYGYVGAGRSAYFGLAARLVEFANQLKLPEDQRGPVYKGKALDSLKMRFYSAINTELEQEILSLQLANMKAAFGDRNPAFNKLLAGQTPAASAAGLARSTVMSSEDQVKQFLNGNPDNILQSSDPFIAFVASTSERASEVRDRYNELVSREQGKVQLLGRALFGLYGTSIPPDATFSLRIADGVVRGYEYNGTLAPYFTTFYGMYDRHYAFNKKDPWDLPDRWRNPPPSFDMSTPLNFVSTNDIIGGNSGSPVVNKNLEICGIAFDGNIESLPNDLISTDEYMRCVSVHSAGILEALDDIYKAERLVNELKTGRISN